MRLCVTLTAVCLALLLNAPTSQAQCGPCASAMTMAACIACSRKSSKNPGNWTEAGIRKWCATNMPACRRK